MMRSSSSARPTVGVLVGWPVYYGASILRYLHTVLDGIYTAAVAADCNLLLACGMDGVPFPRARLPAWPLPGADTTFVPVGPWNTDGLIVVAMYLNATQEAYLRGLGATGLPLVYTGFEGPGVSVNLDNAGGVRQALEHLHAHGHRRIAFIAGLDPPFGESGPRLQAYYAAMRDLDLPVEPRLVAHGELIAEGGRRAMRQLLAVTSGACAPFTAVLACNDSSAFGAAEVLQEHGLRVPDDIALVGFDNLLEARAHVPPLTTVHNPAFAVGQQSLHTLLDVISGQPLPTTRIHVPVRLVVRRSCGCRSGVDRMGAASLPQPGAATCDALAQAISAAVLLETRSGLAEAQSMCRRLVDSLLESVQAEDETCFENELLGVLERVEALDDDAHTWHIALAVLEQGLDDLQPALPPAQRRLAADRLERARLIVSERTRQQAARALLRQEELAVNVGQMSAELLMALDAAQIPAILAEHLPPLGVSQLLAALYTPEGDDPVARSQPILRYGVPTGQAMAEAALHDGADFDTRRFPPPGLYAQDHPFRLALLPFAPPQVGSGFVAFDAGNLEPCAAIVRNLAAALAAGKLYAAALHGRQQAEEAARLKSRFLSMVSHELRTPLNLIVGLSELLLRETPASPALPEGMRRDLQRIYTSGQHLAQLIGDVLDLASSEAGQLRLLAEPLDLSDVLAAVALAGEQMAQEKGLAWQAQLPATGPWVMGDRTRLRQVALNLVSNAVKFTAHGGVALTAAAVEGEAVVTVSDTGPGVPPKEQAAIFGEFERGEHTLVGSYGGLGLGLAICKQLVELHGGRIEVHSSGEEGAGAIFRFTLPAIPAPAASAGAAGAKTVLIVEDDPGVLDLHTRLVQQLPAHHQVLQAASGRQALALMHATRPDLVLLDLRLPDLDGFAVLKAMRSHELLRNVPVVVLTAQAPAEADMERLDAGVAAVLSKGVFGSQELLAHIETALTGAPKLGSATQSLVRQALAYIHAHFAEPLGRKQIAASAGISEDYLTQCFHQELGITPITYLQRYRVQQARRLLEGGRCSVTEAALAVGFADLTYFGRVFQREVGVTPSAYRRGERPHTAQN